VNDNEKYGLLLTPNIKLHRQYFREMVRLLGIQVLYRAPRPNKHFNTYAEIESDFMPPIRVGCLFEGTPTQQTMKKLGWVAELDTEASIIHVDYDLPDIQVGALFIVPSGIDESKGRLFRVTKMSYNQIYPASITCEIVPEYEDTIDQVAMNDYTASDFNLITEEPDPSQFIPDDEGIRRFGPDEDDFL